MGSLARFRHTRHGREQRVFAVTLAVFALFVLCGLAWVYGPAYVAYWNYSPQEGDILFQSLPRSGLVNAIEGATGSPFSHCGIVAKRNGAWVVYEAYRKVEATPLKAFIFRGRNQGFAVYRLKPEYQQYIPATLAKATTYLGRPYDARYRMDEQRIYCSELIYKAYQEASGQQLGSLVRLGDLNWRPFESTIADVEGGPPPLDREIITPRHMAEASQLQLILAHKCTRSVP